MFNRDELKKPPRTDNPFEYLRKVTAIEIATEYSAKDLCFLIREMVFEIDEGLRWKDKYDDLLTENMKNADRGSFNTLLGVLAGIEITKPEEERDPKIIEMIEKNSE